jgi:ribonuclease HI
MLYNPITKKFLSTGLKQTNIDKFCDSSYENETFVNELAIISPQESDKTLICFTDGSYLKANSKGGFSVVWPYHEELDYAEKLVPSTNNRAEYSGVIHALKQADELDPTKTKTLIIYTDSMLIINSMTKWLPTWKRNNYKKSDGKPVLNQDLILLIDNYMKQRHIVFRHVMAHTNAKTWEAIYNDKADKMARNISIK